MTTLGGRKVTVTVAPNGTKYINDVPIIGPDFLTSTGAFHVIERPVDVNRTDARPDLSNNAMTMEQPNPAAVPSSSHVSSLSTAAKAGIGVGVGVGAIVAVSLAVCCISIHNRQRTHMRSPTTEAKPTSNHHNASDERGDWPLRGNHEMSVARSGQE